MSITSTQLAEIREWIGTSEPPSDATLEEYFDELGTTPAVALRVVRQRLATLRAQAAKFTAEGDYSEDWSANIKALEGLEGRLVTAAASAAIAAGTGSGTLTVGVLERDDRCR